VIHMIVQLLTSPLLNPGQINREILVTVRSKFSLAPNDTLLIINTANGAFLYYQNLPPQFDFNVTYSTPLLPCLIQEDGTHLRCGQGVGPIVTPTTYNLVLNQGLPELDPPMSGKEEVMLHVAAARKEHRLGNQAAMWP